jgi:hypothetical protein
VIEELAGILRTGPLNSTRRHQIKKLTNVKPRNGQWRTCSGVYRLRFDVCFPIRSRLSPGSMQTWPEDGQHHRFTPA